MKKRNYESPYTKFVEVEMEGNLCGSVFEPGTKDEGVSISGHYIGNEADYSFDENGLQNDTWD